jgi:tetratricopeptide (TPR) repeat protein
MSYEMDLLDFEAQDLYFEQEEAAPVTQLLKQASSSYAEGDAEMPLLQAYFLAPQSLNVLVALNRFYYHQHRLEEALLATEKACQLVTAQLNFPLQWQDVNLELITKVPPEQLTKLRLYLFILKSSGFLNMRLLRLDLSEQIFEKLVELDSMDRIGAKGLLELVKNRKAES